MLPYSQEVGKQEDWAAVVTNVQMIDTPCLGWLPVGKNPVQAERLYQTDYFDNPVTNSHPDGKPVTGAKSAGRNRAQVRSVIQYSTKDANVSKLTQDFGNNAAVPDELAREITNQTKELSRDIESAILSAQECRVGVTGTTGYLTRGIPNWIATGAQAVYPVDASVRPPTGSVDVTTVSTTLTEDAVLNVLQSIGVTKRSSQQMTAFISPSAKRAFNNFPIFVSSSATTVNAGAYKTEIRGGILDRGIESYKTDFGPIDLIVSYNNHALDAAAGSVLTKYSTFYLHQDMWEVAWGTGGMPKWMNKPYTGGLYEAFCECIWMLTCWNPKGEGKWEPPS
jgi:hypothetical protein